MITAESCSFETMTPTASFSFRDDFAGAGHAAIPAAGSPVAGYPWVKRVVGAAPPIVAPLANQSGGAFQLALASTSEKEDAVLYWNDARAVDVTKGLVFECRAALTVPPNAAGVQAVFGVADVWTDGPDNNPHYLEFGCNGNANLLCRSQDGITQNNLAAVAQQTGKTGPLWSPSGQSAIAPWR